MPKLFNVEQEVRKSHCSKSADRLHECVGTCKITPTGVELECSLCGTDEHTHPAAQANLWLERRAADILHAAGASYAALNLDTQMNVLREVAKDFCPNCKTLHVFVDRFQSYASCECGWVWTSGGGWRKPRPLPVSDPIDDGVRASTYASGNDEDVPF